MDGNELKSLLADGAGSTASSRIVRALSERGALSARQITGITGLAKSTVSISLAELRKSGLVVEGDHPAVGKSARLGRPATVLTLNPQAGTCVGIMVGLAEIRMIVADVSHAIIHSTTVELEPDFSAERAAEVTRQLIRETYSQHSLPLAGLLGVGVAVAGPVNPITGSIQRASVVPTWAGIDVRTVFGPILQCPILVDNESNCAALAEMMWGAAVGYEDFVLFKVGLNVGGAIVCGGRVVRGIAGSAGEFGHMSINPDGDLCRCGNRGCLELYAGFRRPLDQASRVFERPMTMDAVMELARQGDIACLRLIKDTAEIAGRGLAIISSVINPGLIIIGGRMALAGDLLLAPLAASYDRHSLVKSSDVPEASRTRIIVGKFTTNDACMGAVGLVLRHHGRLP